MAQAEVCPITYKPWRTDNSSGSIPTTAPSYSGSNDSNNSSTEIRKQRGYRLRPQSESRQRRAPLTEITVQRVQQHAPARINDATGGHHTVVPHDKEQKKADWTCSICTYTNIYESEACAICLTGTRDGCDGYGASDEFNVVSYRHSI